MCVFVYMRARVGMSAWVFRVCVAKQLTEHNICARGEQVAVWRVKNLCARARACCTCVSPRGSQSACDVVRGASRWWCRLRSCCACACTCLLHMRFATRLTERVRCCAWGKQVAVWRVELLPRGSDDTDEDSSRATSQAAQPLDEVVVSLLSSIEVRARALSGAQGRARA